MQFISYPFSFLVVSIAGWMNQHQQQVIEFLMEEHRVLREQMGTRRMRFIDDQRRRLAVKAKQLGRKLLSQVATILTPETLLAWHRKLIAKKYDGARPGGPDDRQRWPKSRCWIVGWRRKTGTGVIGDFQGALANLGHVLAYNTIARILRQHGIEPAPERIRKTTCKEFLSRHWAQIVASDFVTMEVWTKNGL
jgi:hypothetical protein